MDVRNAIGNKTADALLEAVHRVERADDESLLIARIPHCGAWFNAFSCKKDDRVQ